MEKLSRLIKSFLRNSVQKFSNAVLHESSIKLSDLQNDGICKSICKDTIKYQKERIKDILREDEEYAYFADDLPSPFLIYSTVLLYR